DAAISPYLFAFFSSQFGQVWSQTDARVGNRVRSSPLTPRFVNFPSQEPLNSSLYLKLTAERTRFIGLAGRQQNCIKRDRYGDQTYMKVAPAPLGLDLLSHHLPKPSRVDELQQTRSVISPYRLRYVVPDLPTTDEILPYLRQIDEFHWYSNFGPM